MSSVSAINKFPIKLPGGPATPHKNKQSGSNSGSVNFTGIFFFQINLAKILMNGTILVCVSLNIPYTPTNAAVDNIFK